MSKRVLSVETFMLIALFVGAVQAKDELCTDGIDCYCDCVEGSDRGDGFTSDACERLGVPTDPDLIWCDDYEDETYENPGTNEYGLNGGWFTKHPMGSTSPCRVAGVEFEGSEAECLNILHDSTSTDYDPQDPDFNCDKPGFTDCVFQGNQSMGTPIRVGGKGGMPGQFPFAPTNTLSHTFALRIDSDWHCPGTDGNTCKGGNWIKGDKSGDGQLYIAPMGGGSDNMGRSTSECRGSTTGGKNLPFSSIFFQRQHCGSGWNGGSNQGIGFRCGCTTDDCFSDPGTRQGGECHQAYTSTPGKEMSFAPDASDYQFGVPGGIPNPQFGANGDGHDEWMCIQWSVQDIKSSAGKYKFWVNGVRIMNFENLELGNTPTPELFQYTYVFTKEGMSGGKDWMQARDNFHLTRSATPVPCSQIGFNGVGNSEPPPTEPPPTEPPPTEPPPTEPPPTEPPPTEPPPTEPPTSEPPTSSQTPYNGQAASIPGRIEMENFDLGGLADNSSDPSSDDSTWFDWTSGNGFGGYRTDTDVDIAATDDPSDSGGFNLSSVGGNEWVEHTVQVIADGTYDLRIRSNTTKVGKTLRVEVDDVDLTGSVSFPLGWSTVVVEGIELTAGTHIIRTVFESGGTNANYLEFVLVDGTPPSDVPLGKPGQPVPQ
jgi:hypothetical protein